MKKLFLSLSGAFIALAMNAVPVKPGYWRTVTLADGSNVRVEMAGDENIVYWRSADGVCYRPLNGNSNVFERVEAEKLQQELSLTLSARQKREEVLLAKAPRKVMAKADKFQGKKKCLVILANFADTKFKPEHNKALYEKIVNGENFADEALGFRGSVADYFKAQSNGQFEIDFDVVGPVTLSKGYAAYGANDDSGRDQADLVYPMISEAVTLAKSEVKDWKQYDWDGDGLVEEVFVLYAGHGQATYPSDGNLVWPHKSAIDPLEVADGVKVSVYACSCELGATEAIDGIGAFCHEFSHCMGLKDHYDINGKGYGTGYWDLMCVGSYNGNSFVPAGYTSYEKMFCGWKQPIELNTEPKTVDGMKALTDDGDSYIIYNDGNRNEYYMLENRQKKGWDAELPGEGLLVLHVDYDKGAWENNQLNYYSSRQRMTIVPADDSFGSSDENRAADAWPYGDSKNLSNYSRPASTVYNTNTDGTNFMNKFVMNIARNADGTISFDYTTKEAMSTEKPEGALVYESFDNCAGIGGNDDIWGGDNVGKADFVPDEEGWSGTPKTGANKCALFGNATRKANFVTPSFSLAEPVVMSFLAAPYEGSTDNSLTVSANYGCDASVDAQEFELVPGKWTQVKFKVKGTGNASVRIKSNGGLFIDTVCAMPESLSAITSVVSADETKADGKIYTLDGKYVGKDINSLANGVYVVNGKKIVK